ncbi:AAA family ATPase [Candidatus Palauibacter sp.]|uniref:AAA family ATPase n=1 Tax=Candidatus Palauibacter sp. TaxID=3101350 RepID=UPI003B027626
MIKRIYIDNYKCFVNFELRLHELTLLVGRNGAGKTSVLDALYALRRLLEGTSRVTDRDIFPPSSRTRWQDRAVQVFETDVELNGDEFVYRMEVEQDPVERRARINLEALTGNGGPLFRFERGKVQLYRDDHSEGPEFLADWTESALARVVEMDKNARLTRFLRFMRDTVVCRLNPPAFAAEADDEDQTLARDGTNFVRFYRHLLQERQHLNAEYVQAMKEVLDGLRGFRLERVGAETRALVGVFGEADEPWEYRFSELSDGQRALIVLYALTFLTVGQGRVLLIDEPFNYVGLREIQPWLITLADACGSAFPQAVLCSHHPEAIDYLGADRGILLYRDGVGPARVEPLAEGLEKPTGDGPLKLSQLMARGWER